MNLYIDLAVFLNMTVDFLLLLGAQRLSGFPADFWRLSLAALIGGIYSGACLTPALSFLAEPLWYLIIFLLICCTAFGLSFSAIRRGAVFLLLSMALGGMALALQQSRPEILILEGLGLWLLTRVCFGSAPIGKTYVPVQLSYGGRQLSFTALLDTGNQLKDPMTGESVLVLSEKESEKLTGLTPQQLRSPLEVMKAPPIQGLRLIPYSAVGAGSGLLLGLRVKNVKMGNHVRDRILGFAPEGIPENGMYQALTGGILC